MINLLNRFIPQILIKQFQHPFIETMNYIFEDYPTIENY
jgi:hypothetical protein